MATIKFRLTKDNSTPIAFIFDNDDEENVAYTSVGQHSEFSMKFFNECKCGDPSNFKDLSVELVEIGYNFEDVADGLIMAEHGFIDETLNDMVEFLDNVSDNLLGLVKSNYTLTDTLDESYTKRLTDAINKLSFAYYDVEEALGDATIAIDEDIFDGKLKLKEPKEG